MFIILDPFIPSLAPYKKKTRNNKERRTVISYERARLDTGIAISPVLQFIPNVCVSISP
jgi:hypothetical protein